LTNFKQKGLGYKTVLQTAEQEAGFFLGKVGVAGKRVRTHAPSDI